MILQTTARPLRIESSLTVGKVRIPAIVDRSSLMRNDQQYLADAIRDPKTRVLFVASDRNIPIDEQGRLRWHEVSALDPSDELYFLGIDGSGTALLCVNRELEDSQQTATVRNLLGAATDTDAEALLEALALVNWHRDHKFCPACGSPTAIEEAGHSRRCTTCDTKHFPRISPAVIMLVCNEDQCILGRRRGAPDGLWSTLAGFIEAGESAEDAVVREVHEEVGIEVGRVAYKGSQPWPFPAALMLAFEAFAPYGDLVSDEEHLEVRWFSRSELKAKLERNEMTTPPPIAAGHQLIRAWIHRSVDSTIW